MTKVSVIMPVFNCEKYLRACLESLLGQTLKEIEIICVNDGSQDNSLKILQEYAQNDSRIKIIDQHNQGVSIARNNAIKLAKGEFIGFVDADDLIDLDYFEKLYNAAVKNDCDIAAAGIKWVSNNGELDKIDLKFKKFKIYTKTSEKYKVTNVAKKAYIWNKIYKKELFDKFETVFEPGICYEDMMFSHRILHNSRKLITVPNVFYYYRFNPLSLVRTDSPEKKADFKKEILKTIDYVKKHNIKVDLAKYYCKNVKVVKFIGIPILRIKNWDYYSIYYLFRVIPILRVSTKNYF